MKDNDQKHSSARREFLRGTMAAGAGAALVAAVPGVVTAAPEKAIPETEAKQGYRVTPHIAAYYKTAAN